jgi:hypothetical protein
MKRMERLVPVRDGQRDFDFLFGTWKVRNRRLHQPLSGSREWYEFDGMAWERPLWGGNANVEEVDYASPLGRIQGMAVRVYDTAARTWSIYWATATSGLSSIATVGSFDESGVGEFFSDETFAGNAIVCRYRWTREGADSCRWEQAYSLDGGATWETNWTMDFRRAA